MANMSYCRFENTLSDFTDCLDALRSEGLKDLSPYELRAAKSLYSRAKEFVEVYEEITELD